MARPENHGWNHRQCWPCWLKKWGFSRVPPQVDDPEPPVGICCFCGSPTMSGIYVRCKPGHYSVAHCPNFTTSIFAAPPAE